MKKYFLITILLLLLISVHSFSETKVSSKNVKSKKTYIKKTAKKNIKSSKYHVTVLETESHGIYSFIKVYINDMCIKEVPFFVALYRCYYKEERLVKGDTLVLAKLVLKNLKERSIEIQHINEFKTSAIDSIDSMYLFKDKKNKKNENLCNFVAFVSPGSYEIPKTGAKIRVPSKIAGSIYFNKSSGKMVVYAHTMGIRLEIPSYAKAISLGIIGDMDIGFAVLERKNRKWEARLLYTKQKGESEKKGWSFNLTECNKIRPYNE
jgi:hypothetical protein